MPVEFSNTEVCSRTIVNRLNSFKSVGKKVCQEKNINELKLSLGGPSKNKQLFLVYRLENNDFAIQWNDGKLLDAKIACKILPQALAIFLQSYLSLSKNIIYGT